MNFETRFEKLNNNQKNAVRQTAGPLLVIAGPGTGKTELLSMRAAEILRQTDTLASSILCLTFTDSGANNMRERLRQIIGEDAYKVAIHTFHSFGVEIINQHGEYFFQGSNFKPADSLAQYQILRQIFENLDWQHPLASQNNGDFIHLKDATDIISEFKTSGLTTDELRQIMASNQQIIEQVAPEISEIFATKISKAVIPQFATLVDAISKINTPNLPPNITPYVNILTLSIIHASQEAIETGKTNAITAWKNTWCEKDETGQFVLKDARRAEKLLATIDIYAQYIEAMNTAELYDYDDMILRVIQAVEKHVDLKANLQERFQYIMVDEFQDTNLAQLRLLFDICPKDQPNIMAVGDDDQAIFSFQGADIGNIQRFREHFDPTIIVLSDNYRSTPNILTAARAVITQGEDRLENTIADLSKKLTPHNSAGQSVEFRQYQSPDGERAALAAQIRQSIDAGTAPENIAILARHHQELVEILPYLTKQGILVNYERRDNALDHELVQLIELLARVITATNQGDHDTANFFMPELVAHPAFGFSALEIWQLSLEAWRKHSTWLEIMQTSSSFGDFALWLIEQAMMTGQQSLEQQIDQLIGVDQTDIVTKSKYISPIANFFFSEQKLAENPDTYLDALEALRTIRDQLREHFENHQPSLAQLIDFIDLYRQSGVNLVVVRHRASRQTGHVNLMTVHKSKGLEFNHVFILGAIDKRWGEKVSKRSRLINYPANLPLKPAGDNYDERLRLFFVAMTRAKQSLSISFSATDHTGKELSVASFLSSQTLATAEPLTIDETIQNTEIDWHSRLVQPISTDLKSTLQPILENYKLSVTHLNNFLDVSRGGPQTFLLNNLLRFPQSKSANANYGTAMHSTLQQIHNRRIVDRQLVSTDEALDLFSKNLADHYLSADDFTKFNDRGRQALERFLDVKADTINDSQVTELSFASQGVVLGEARLTGTLDLADLDKTNKTIRVTDYKTGKPSANWQGKTDYEKIKLHKYRQQLMFYQLLIENSRDFSNYQFIGSVLQFVEPQARTGEIFALEDEFSREELAEFSQLIQVVWQRIVNLDLPDITDYPESYKGMLEFEQYLLKAVDS